MESEEPDVRLATMGLLLALSEGFPEVVVPILGEGLTKLTSGPMSPLEAEAWIAVGGLGVHALAAAVVLIMLTTRIEGGRLAGGWIAGLALLSYGGAAYWIVIPHSTLVGTSTTVGCSASRRVKPSKLARYQLSMAVSAPGCPQASLYSGSSSSLSASPIM